jgi:hypothetical protein
MPRNWCGLLLDPHGRRSQRCVASWGDPSSVLMSQDWQEISCWRLENWPSRSGPFGDFREASLRVADRQPRSHSQLRRVLKRAKRPLRQEADCRRARWLTISLVVASCRASFSGQLAPRPPRPAAPGWLLSHRLWLADRAPALPRSSRRRQTVSCHSTRWHRWRPDRSIIAIKGLPQHSNLSEAVPWRQRMGAEA